VDASEGMATTIIDGRGRLSLFTGGALMNFIVNHYLHEHFIFSFQFCYTLRVVWG
jgi:hypothetical protein